MSPLGDRLPGKRNLLMVKTLDFKVGEKFYKDTSSKGQVTETVKPRFLKLDITPRNLSIHLKTDFGGLFLRKLMLLLCVSSDVSVVWISNRGPYTDLKVEMKTLPHNQVLSNFCLPGLVNR